MVDSLAGHQLVFFRHPWRDCIYDEADACVKTPKYDHRAVRKQIRKYGEDQMPRHYGLWACGSFAFRNNPAVRQFRHAWWRELRQTSTMDQICLPYLLRRQGFKEHLKTVDLDIYANEYLKYNGHKMDYVARQGREFYGGGSWAAGRTTSVAAPAGRERWRLPLGPFNNIYGMGASPVIAGDLVVLACDQSTGSFLVAVDKHTGQVRWRTPRPEARSGHATPIARSTR